MKSPLRVLAGLLVLLVVGVSLFSLDTDMSAALNARPAAMPGGESFLAGIESGPAARPAAGPRGPIVTQSAAPYVWNGDLRDLPQAADQYPYLQMPSPGQIKGRPMAGEMADPVAQTYPGTGKMPAPLMNFDGLMINDGGGWHPPDTHGDVGPNHYVQVVNIAIGIYDKATGAELVNLPYNTFFQGPPGSACDSQNAGDVVVVYDEMADRWIVSDFSFPGDESRQCIAVSQSGDPVAGGWYFYDVDTKDPTYGSWCDYPKMGVWPDAYYLTCNMFDPWVGANVFALDRAAMLSGAPATAVMFGTGANYGSLLPSNVRGTVPPAGAPNYMASVEAPTSLYLWEFHVDWTTPGNSTFTGPVDVPVASFIYAPWTWIPQGGTQQKLDSLGDRLMCQLQYRNMGSYEALYVNHTVFSNEVAGVRWYEVRDPGGAPAVYQQGTYQPDGNFRWMGSIAADKDGNIALGYSVSSPTMYPSVRYTGRLNGEVLGLMLQGETSLIEGTGSQSSSNRWGDYSGMSIDPVDGCTFWYTQEYFKTTGGAWYTRIGSFRFPSCGQPKGSIVGTVRDAATLQPLAGVWVIGTGATAALTMTAETDAGGTFAMALPAGTFTLTAGPLMPGYPDPAVAVADVTAGATTTVDLVLVPQPYLAEAGLAVDDDVPGGNANGYTEPGESGLMFWLTIANTGATTATNVAAHLIAQTAGVTVAVADAAYPDIAAGHAEVNLTAFTVSFDPALPCGGRVDFANVLTTDQGVYTAPVRLYLGVPQPPAPFFFDNMESGPGNWTTGGTNNHWTITMEQSHSPTRAWSDSPNGNYQDNTDAWLRSPIFNLSTTIGTGLTFWHRYSLEQGYDYGYVQYSVDGGATWKTFPVAYDGYQAWNQQSWATPVLDEQAGAAFRFRLTSDGGVTADGWYIDDVTLYYQPFACTYQAPEVPTLLAPPDGALITTTHDVTLTWQPEGTVPVESYNVELDGGVVTTTETFWAGTLAAGTHTWRVRACNAVACSDYSAAWSFEIVDAPGTPVLLSPTDGTLFTTTHQVAFSWEAGAGGPPDAYTLAVNGAVVTTTAGTSYTATLAAGAYTWTVRAENAAGQSPYAPAWNLEVIDPAGVPVLLAPADGLVTTTAVLTFTWEAGAGGPPDGYNIELDGTVITTTAPVYSATLALGEHTWRVRAYNAAGYTAYSAAWTVTVEEVRYQVFLPLVQR